MEDEADIEADEPLAADKAALIEILMEEGDLTRMGKFWMRLEVATLKESSEDFRWLWDDGRADAGTAAGTVAAFLALVDHGYVLDDEQCSEASARGAGRAA